MPTSSSSAVRPGGPRFASDVRWQVAERVMRSPHFAKSSRLCEFLTFIVEETLAGRAEDLNEQRIGIHVFERRVDYDSAEDNIVRSNASRLRQRLEAYFQNEGAAEPIRIELRRGSYVPVFTEAPVEEPPTITGSSPTIVPPAAVPDGSQAAKWPTSRNAILWTLGVAVVLLLLLASYQQVRYARLAATRKPTTRFLRAFWSQIFSPGRRNLIVPADSSLVLFENLIGRPVGLQEYLSHGYLAGSVNGPSESLEEDAKWIANRRLTSVADIEFATALLRIPEVADSEPRVRFTRDLQVVDLKEANLVLIGAEESDPWLSIFQPYLNFVISNDQKSTKFTVQNRSPRPNEKPVYEYDPRDPGSSAYALIALRPNLSGSGRVLIVEGTGIAGTQAAAEFLMDRAGLEGVLGSAFRASGQVPPFEVLLQTTNLNGSAPRSQFIAVRVQNYGSSGSSGSRKSD